MEPVLPCLQAYFPSRHTSEIDLNYRFVNCNVIRAENVDVARLTVAPL